jgi:hypothetical protein
MEINCKTIYRLESISWAWWWSSFRLIFSETKSPNSELRTLAMVDSYSYTQTQIKLCRKLQSFVINTNMQSKHVKYACMYKIEFEIRVCKPWSWIRDSRCFWLMLHPKICPPISVFIWFRLHIYHDTHMHSYHWFYGYGLELIPKDFPWSRKIWCFPPIWDVWNDEV